MELRTSISEIFFFKLRLLLFWDYRNVVCQQRTTFEKMSGLTFFHFSRVTDCLKRISTHMENISKIHFTKLNHICSTSLNMIIWMLLLIQYFGVYKFKVLLYYAKNVVKHTWNKYFCKILIYLIIILKRSFQLDLT